MVPDNREEFNLEYGPPDCDPRYRLYPETTEVLGFQVSETLCGCVVWVPAPLNVCFNEASEALLTNEMLPGEVPAAAGVKVTVYCAVWPAVTLIGKEIPLTEYPDPLQAADETVTSALAADRVPVKDELLPTATFPKFSVDGDTASDPVVGGGGGWVLDAAETPAQPASADTLTSASRVQSRRKRELFTLSITRLSVQGRLRSREPKAMDQRRKLNCTLVTWRTIIELAGW
jgi:hypothetical protein